MRLSQTVQAKIIRCVLAPDKMCHAPLLGTAKNTGTEWSDESCALIHGPVTGVRMWHTTVGNNRIKLWVNIGYFKSLRGGGGYPDEIHSFGWHLCLR